MSKRPCPSDEDHQSPRKKSHTASASQDAPAPIPDFSSCTEWTAADIPSEIPPLPPILDAEIERDVFTHPGLDDTRNYEWLEFLGDAYLEMLATVLIHKTFRKSIPVGRGSQIREQIVRNTTLAEYYQQYNLDQRARIPKSIELAAAQSSKTKRTAKDLIKIQGDIFEAYVAGVVLSDPKNGLQAVAKWLKALWAMTLKDQIKQEERRRASMSQTEPVPDQAQSSTPVAKKTTFPKDELANRILVRGVSIRYVDMKSGQKKDRYTNLPLFVVGVYLDGWGETDKLLGIGSALQKKEAGQIAASRALENKKLMKVYEAKKRAFKEAQAAAEGIAGQEQETKTT